MHYTIQLCFSEAGLAELTPVFLQLDSPVTRHGDRPHLSLLGYEAADEKGIREAIRKTAEDVPEIPVTLAAVGVFPGAENVVYLAPIVTRQLLELHARLFENLHSLPISPSPYYTPEHWVPHVGVSLGSEADKLRILETLAGQAIFKEYLFSAIEFISYPPGKLLHRVELGAL